MAFLNDVGYFSKINRFWTDVEFPEAPEIRERIRKKLKGLKLNSSEAQWASALIEAAT